jgi:3-oxoacyl-[acyl-carrier protein] reductase
MNLLANKTALITGGTSGIGLAIAKKFAEHGAFVILFGQSLEKGAAAVAELPENKAIFHSIDVSKTEIVEKAIKELLAEYGKIDILVNNAGITRDELMMKMTENDWDQVLDTNAKSCFNTCRALTRPMLKARSGKIINISSVIGLIGNAGQVNYAASKGAIIAMTKSMALEFASRSINVNCIAPGFISTQMTGILTESQKDSILSKIPLGRMGFPEEIANAALFLASSLSDYITGQVLTVDGGMVM